MFAGTTSMKKRNRTLAMRILAGLAIAAAAVLVLTPSMAQAAPGSLTSNVNVRSGPGPGFSVLGLARAGESVDVGDCRTGFCYVTRPGPAVDGWVSADFINRSGPPVGPGGPGWGPGGPGGPGWGPGGPGGPGWGPGGPGGPGWGPGGPGWGPGRPGGPGWGQRPREACFFEHAQYAGRSFCVARGETIRNLARVSGNWNDIISSIRNEDRLTVEVCTDAEFRGVCRTYTTGTSYVGAAFNDRISSIRVR